MNHDDSSTTPDPHSHIEPELEARLCAWVLSEASAFEAAELERLCGERPELAALKRRIETVHGLVSEAAAPGDSAYRLSPERRAQVLQTIGAPAEPGAGLGETGSPGSMTPATVFPDRRRQRSGLGWIVRTYGLAASMLIVISGYFLFAPGGIPLRESARRGSMPTEPGLPEMLSFREVESKGAGEKARQERYMGPPNDRALAMDPVPASAPAPARGNADYYYTNPTDGSNALSGEYASSDIAPATATYAWSNDDKKLGSDYRTLSLPPPIRATGTQASLSVPRAADLAAPEPVREGDDGWFGETIVESPFEVTTEESEGYTASATLAGNRLNTELRDIGNAVTVVTRESLADLAPASSPGFLQYTTGTEVSGQRGSFDAATNPPRDEINGWSSYSIDRVDLDRGPNSILFGQGNPSDIGVYKDSSISDPTLLESYNQSFEQSRIRGLAVADNSRDHFPADIPWDSYNQDFARDGSNQNTRQFGSATWEPGFLRRSSAQSQAQLTDANSRDSSPTDTTNELNLAIADMRKASGRGDSPAASTPAFIEHDVQPGDTLAALSRRHGVSVADIMRLNEITDPRRLQVAMKLRIPTPASDTKPEVPPPPPPPVILDDIDTAVEATSTFSLHVSDVSFRLAQAALARGEVPDSARIRPEEFYNAFDYGDPAPTAAEKIACRIEQAAHPLLQQRNLVRIAVRVPATGRGAGQPLRLTVLLDTSGSMEREDRLASVQRALEVLASLLGPNDRVTLIGFARQPRLLAEALPGDQAATLSVLAAQTPAEGGTNLEAALELALAKAQQYFDAAAQNRVVLITDGAANLGNADPARLGATIETARAQGLAFDACGVGTDGLDDSILEALTRKGDGRYYVLDSAADADAGFARQLAGAFRPAAQNVKLQVRFNPARVARYRLIGFEQHRLRNEDFRNDRVDAAELAAEEAAVAVYQVEVRPEGEGELGDVFVRFRDTSANAMVERSWTMPFDARASTFDRASSSVQLAGIAALLAEKLKGGPQADLVRLDELAPVASALRGKFPGNARVQELVTMFEQTRRLVGE